VVKRNPPIVIKLGGRALEGAGAAHEFARDLASLGQPAVIVHGGGAEVSAWCERLGLRAEFIDGLRVTDAATLEVAVAVLAGLANKRLVAALGAASLDAVGLAALDGGIADVVPHARAAVLGAVGEVRAIRAEWLETLLDAGRIPVLASVGAHAGALLNVNADDLAGALAVALRARTLVLFSDVDGVRLRSGTVRVLPIDAIDRAIADGEVTGGMIAKLRAARTAFEHGVTDVHIAEWHGPGTLRQLAQSPGPGTRLTASHDDDRAFAAQAAASPLGPRGDIST
jgi:acetylglutamate kinase